MRNKILDMLIKNGFDAKIGGYNSISIKDDNGLEQLLYIAGVGRQAIFWSVEDIKTYAEHIGWELSAEECDGILDDMINDHDAEMGITWDTVHYYITKD